jgi:hypothetical protein
VGFVSLYPPYACYTDLGELFMTEYLYPTHPCGAGDDKDKNWLELRVRDGWKQSCLPYFCLPFISNVTGPWELNSSTTPYQQEFWLYFYYAEKSIKEFCPSKEEKKALAKKLEYRARVVEYSDTQTELSPSFDNKDVFVIPIDEVKGVTNVKFWFKCDKFEEVKVITTPNNFSKTEGECRLLTLSDFQYAGTVYNNSIGLALQRVSPFKLISPIIVTQTTWHKVEQT